MKKTPSPPRPKPITPYARLLEESQQFAAEALPKDTAEIWTSSSFDFSPNTGDAMKELRACIVCADKLGFETVLRVNSGTIKAVGFPKRPGSIPWNLHNGKYPKGRGN
jgi:hypothetical protein